MEMKRITNILLLLALVGSMAALSADFATAGSTVQFRLDPRLTRSLYMGDRWVSPKVFTQVAEPGGAVIIQAKVVDADSMGRVSTLIPECSVSNTAMATVSSAPGNIAVITVTTKGKSTLTVGGKTFRMKARVKNGALRVDIR